MLPVWGSLLTLVASQSCLDSSENSATWVRLKPLGQCKDEESTCPYRITLPPLTIQLPKPFRELEKMARELRSLTQLVNQLKEDCCVCKERHGMDRNIQTDEEGKDGKRIQASRGTLNTRERQQDIAKGESTIKVTTSRSVAEDTMTINSDAKDVIPTGFGKQRNTNQERNVNPHSSKPKAVTNGGPKGSKPSQEKMISGSMSKVGEVSSLTTTKKDFLQSPVAKLTESSFSGDLDSEQPTQHEKHKANRNQPGHETHPSGTLTAKGKVMTILKYPVLTEDDDDDDDVETKQLQTPKGDKVLGERRLVTGTDTQDDRELDPDMKQLTRKQQDKEDKEVGVPGLKETRSNIFYNTNNGNVAKGSSVSVIQQPSLKKTNHSASSTKPKPLKPGAYSERDVEGNSRPVNTADTIRRQKELTSPVTGKANTSVNISRINPQTLEIQSKNAFKPGTDAKMNAGSESKQFNTAESASGQATSPSPISGLTYDIVDVSPTNSQILGNKKQLNAGTDSESNAGMSSNPVNYVDPVSIVKNSRSPISGSINATADIEVINPKIPKSNTQTKSSKSAENNIGLESNPINKIETESGQETSRTPISGISDGKGDASRTDPQILDSKNQHGTGADSESDTAIDSNPINNVSTVSGLKNSRPFTSDRADPTAEVDLINPKSLNSQNAFRHGTDIKSNSGTDSHPFNVSETVGRLQMPKSPVSDIVDAVEVNQPYPGTVDGSFKNPFKFRTDRERKAKMDSKPLNKVEKVSPPEMPQLSITSRDDATVNVNQLNPPHSRYSNSEETFNPLADSGGESTVKSTPVTKVETVSQLETSRSPISGRFRPTADQINPQAMDYISKNPLKPGTVSERKAGTDPNRDLTTDTGSQRETSASPISDSRLDVNGTNPSLTSNDDFPRRPLLPKSKLNMTQSRTRQIKTSNPMSIDPDRRNALRNNKTSSLRSDAMRSGRYQPTGRTPTRLQIQQKIPNQPERNAIPGLSLSKEPRRRKPYILQKNPINYRRAFGSGGPKNTTGAKVYTMSNGTTHVDSKPVSSPNNELNSTAFDTTQSFIPTFSTQGIVDQAHVKTAKPAPTVEVLHTMLNHQNESTSQNTVTKPRLEKPGGNSGQDLVLDTLYNIGRNSQPSVMEEIKDTDRRTKKPPFTTSSGDSNQEKHKKPPRVESIQNLFGKMPVAVVSSERNELNYPTTAATPYTTETGFKNKHSKMPQFTPPITSPPHFTNEDRAEQAKTTSGVKESNKHAHHRVENHSQETESKRSHSDTGNKELQSARSGQRSGALTDLEPNPLDSTQHRDIGSMDIVMDRVKVSPDSKVSATSSESSSENRERDTNPIVIDWVEANTEVDQIISSSDNAPVTYHRYSKTPLRSVDSIEPSNGGHSLDNNNGNFYSVGVDKMTGATGQKFPAGHANNGDKKKPLTVNNMDDRHGLEEQLFSNCHGQCDTDPTPRSILNSHESSSNDRGKECVAFCWSLKG